MGKVENDEEAMSAGSKKMGRPPKPEAEKRQQIGVRTSPELKDKLELSAGSNGRSVAQEAELRLVQSFRQEDQDGGQKTQAFTRLIAALIGDAEAQTGKRWQEDTATWSAVKEVVTALIDRYKPAPPNLRKIEETFEAAKATERELKELRERLEADLPRRIDAATGKPLNTLLDLFPPEIRFAERADGQPRSAEEIEDLGKRAAEIERLGAEVHNRRREFLSAWSGSVEEERRGGNIGKQIAANLIPKEE